MRQKDRAGCRDRPIDRGRDVERRARRLYANEPYLPSLRRLVLDQPLRLLALRPVDLAHPLLQLGHQLDLALPAPPAVNRRPAPVQAVRVAPTPEILVQNGVGEVPASSVVVVVVVAVLPPRLPVQGRAGELGRPPLVAVQAVDRTGHRLADASDPSAAGSEVSLAGVGVRGRRADIVSLFYSFCVFCLCLWYLDIVF